MIKKLMSLTLALLICMMLPVLALGDSYTGDGTYEGYYYKGTVSATTTKASGTFSYNDYNGYLDCTVRATIPMGALNGTIKYSYGYGSGYVSISASTGNTVNVNGTICTDEISAGTLYCYVRDTLIRTISAPV